MELAKADGTCVMYGIDVVLVCTEVCVDEDDEEECVELSLLCTVELVMSSSDNVHQTRGWGRPEKLNKVTSDYKIFRTQMGL